MTNQTAATRATKPPPRTTTAAAAHSHGKPVLEEAAGVGLAAGAVPASVGLLVPASVVPGLTVPVPVAGGVVVAGGVLGGGAGGVADAFNGALLARLVASFARE